MDEGILLISNIVGIFCLISLLNRFRYTIPVVGTITSWSCRRVSSESETEYTIGIKYLVNGSLINTKHSLTHRIAFHYKEGDRISLRLLPNNPYKYIITHDHIEFTFKFFIIVAVILDIYTYLEVHNLLHFFF